MDAGRPATRIVVLAGGSPHAHDFAAVGGALVELLAPLADHVEHVRHPDEAAGALDGTVDVLVVDGLWWRMLGAGYDRWRDAHAYSPPPSTRRALADHVRGGGGLVALHTAVICFDDWPEWGEVVGASWRWGVSWHPEQGPVRARLVREHPVVAGLGPQLALDDEVYGDLDVHESVEVLAVARRHEADAEQPVVWVHRYGQGRVVFDGFGHDAASIAHPGNARLILQAAQWAARGAPGRRGGAGAGR